MVANNKKVHFNFSVTHRDASCNLNLQSNLEISYVGPSKVHICQALSLGNRIPVLGIVSAPARLIHSWPRTQVYSHACVTDGDTEALKPPADTEGLAANSRTAEEAATCPALPHHPWLAAPRISGVREEMGVSVAPGWGWESKVWEDRRCSQPGAYW